MRVLEEGRGELLGWMDPDDARLWMAERKSRGLEDKVMTIGEAVSRFTGDGDYFAMGGFGHIRVSMAAIYEMIRQGRRGMAMAAKTAVHDVEGFSEYIEHVGGEGKMEYLRRTCCPIHPSSWSRSISDECVLGEVNQYVPQVYWRQELHITSKNVCYY